MTPRIASRPGPWTAAALAFGAGTAPAANAGEGNPLHCHVSVEAVAATLGA
jgi:hypothetical protein